MAVCHLRDERVELSSYANLNAPNRPAAVRRTTRRGPAGKGRTNLSAAVHSPQLHSEPGFSSPSEARNNSKPALCPSGIAMLLRSHTGAHFASRVRPDPNVLVLKTSCTFGGPDVVTVTSVPRAAVP